VELDALPQRLLIFFSQLQPLVLLSRCILGELGLQGLSSVDGLLERFVLNIAIPVPIQFIV